MIRNALSERSGIFKKGDRFSTNSGGTVYRYLGRELSSSRPDIGSYTILKIMDSKGKVLRIGLIEKFARKFQ